jgi:NADH-quinone oxidoreductase subunit G
LATIYIDNQRYDVPDGQNLLNACLSLGLNLPYFCWHPAMHSVGACRQCAVKQFENEKDTQGRIVMACMTLAADGTRISIDDPEAAAFRAGVIELLMSNHPHDCPVCDEGGECHLQDMTLMTGHDYRRFRFRKRTHRNQYLGPFLTHEMNRCIACYRCVRFYNDYAGGRDLNVFYWHNDVYFGRHEDGVLESEFAGNLAEVCPTGVFTDKTLAQHYTRKWDLQTAPSVCVHCGVGCNTIPGERYGTLRRIRNRYNAAVNGYFLCDRGRYGYEFVNHARRVRHPLVRASRYGPAGVIGRAQALSRVAAAIGAGRHVLGIGSPRASLEANFALRTLVGAERFSCGLAERDVELAQCVIDILRRGCAHSPSLSDVRSCDATLVLGEDVNNTAPVVALALRQSTLTAEIQQARSLRIPAWDDAAVRRAIQQDRGPFYVATAAGTRLDDIATRTYRGGPDRLVRLALAVASRITAEVPSPGNVPGSEVSLVEDIVRDLLEADRPLVVSGTSTASRSVLQAAANVAWALCATGRKSELLLTLPECNSFGLALLGGSSLETAVEQIERGEVDTLVVLENDLSRRADRSLIDRLLGAAKHVVVIDHVETTTAAQADVILPAATFAESDGTLVNSEGRAQRFYQVFPAADEVQEGWRWIREIAICLGRHDMDAWQGLDQVTADMVGQLPAFGGLETIAPPADYRVAGMRIARQTHRASGRTAIHAAQSVHEPQPATDPDSPLSFSMEGYYGPMPPALYPRFWAPGWNSIQSITKFQEEVNGPYRDGNPGLRLIEPPPAVTHDYFTDLLSSESPAGLEAVPLYHVFGSEELSVLAPGVAELSPKPYVALHPADAGRLGVAAGQEVDLLALGTAHRLPVRILPSLAEGLAGLPAGLPGIPTGIWNTIVEVRT